ncbi:50S ribosomal protein L17 [Candidatus Legionella polyplacis]|uniref:Large ribosomal subunit protein bL17 n=1 Tax=Candidatus Legionella polyplacis TaxID=2005262 RepID=A0ABZ2GX04_9GAMM
MRHRCGRNNFNRLSSHKKLMFFNMCVSLIKNEIIKTTLYKGKELRKYIEPIITISKKDSVSARRSVFNKLRSKEVVKKLFNVLGPRYMNRSGGYTRILKCGYRSGDNTLMAVVMLVK